MFLSMSVGIRIHHHSAEVGCRRGGAIAPYFRWKTRLARLSQQREVLLIWKGVTAKFGSSKHDTRDRGLVEPSACSSSVKNDLEDQSQP